jgi:hypothetical protein
VRRYPYHRYLAYQVLNGDSTADIVEHMADLEYVPPVASDVEELRSLLLRRIVTRERRAELGVLFLDEKSPSLDQVFWLVETPPARTCAERLLLDRVHPKHVATILSLKFNEKLTTKAVEMFRDAFWDTSVCTPVDFADYFRMAGDRKPDPPPDSVTLTTRPHYTAWKHGHHPEEDELTPEAMVREIQVDAFMHFKELSAGPAKDMSKAKAMAELVLKTAGARKSLADSRRGKSDGIPEIKPMLTYPQQDVPTIGDLHTEYSENLSGTGAESELMGEREDEPPA